MMLITQYAFDYNTYKTLIICGGFGYPQMAKGSSTPFQYFFSFKSSFYLFIYIYL